MDDSEEKIARYEIALRYLTAENVIYRSNWEIFRTETTPIRKKWINHFENVIPHLPIAKAIKLKIIELRLKGIVK